MSDSPHGLGPGYVSLCPRCAQRIGVQQENAELLAALRLCVPAPSGNIGVSDLNVGFRRGWDACRGFVETQVNKAIAKAEKGT